VGRRAYRQVLTEYRDRLVPDSSPEATRCRRICRHIVGAVGIGPLRKEINLRVHGYTFEWEVHVVREQQVNAFCLPAGKMIVFTGLLPLADSDDLLATVLSHEMSHALAHHTSERLARDRDLSNRNVFRKLAFERGQESEADHIGVFLMAFAGYDPRAAVRFWQRMEQLSRRRGRRLEILSDHPDPQHRARDLQRWAERALAAKKAYDEGRVVREAR
jgi:predicted Zn-dependent protease